MHFIVFRPFFSLLNGGSLNLNDITSVAPDRMQQIEEFIYLETNPNAHILIHRFVSMQHKRTLMNGL